MTFSGAETILTSADMSARGLLPYGLAVLMLVVGLYAIVAKKNVVKIVIGLILIDYAANLFLVLVGFRRGEGGEVTAPILTEGGPEARAAFLANTVDPLPQAMVLTSIVIGLGVVALAVSLAARLYDRYGTFDITSIRKLRG